MLALDTAVRPRHICWDTDTVERVLSWAGGRDGRESLVRLCDAVLAGEADEALVLDALQLEPHIAQDIGRDDLVRGWL